MERAGGVEPGTAARLGRAARSGSRRARLACPRCAVVERLAGDGMPGSRTSPPNQAPARERDELLATKLSLPRTRPDRLARSHLVQQLNEGMARELLLVCTPAGFGKTTLVADWAAS